MNIQEDNNKTNKFIQFGLIETGIVALLLILILTILNYFNVISLGKILPFLSNLPTNSNKAKVINKNIDTLGTLKNAPVNNPLINNLIDNKKVISYLTVYAYGKVTESDITHITLTKEDDSILFVFDENTRLIEPNITSGKDPKEPIEKNIPYIPGEIKIGETIQISAVFSYSVPPRPLRAYIIKRYIKEIRTSGENNSSSPSAN